MLVPRLPIKKFDENGLYQALYINNFKEHLKNFHADISHPHKHDFFMTVLFTSGSGKHTIDFTTYTIESNSLFFLRPEQIHNWEFDEEADGWILFHSEDFYNFYVPNTELNQWPFFSTKNAEFKVSLSPTQTKNILSLFTEISSEYKAIQNFSFLKIASLIIQLYVAISRIFSDTNQSSPRTNIPYQDHFKYFIQLLEQNFTVQHSPKYYAEKMHLTTKHLHRICVANSGKSTSLVIAERLTLEAKRLLASETKTIQEIGLNLGFENTNYFHTFFKKHTGITAKEFLLTL